MRGMVSVMAKQPHIADNKPTVLSLEAGTYWWCSCGKSQTQPWCDGAHKGSGFSPVKLALDQPKTVALCMCKHSASPTLCDGSHGGLATP
jgi:CDGSH-type Zn-finger protein